MGKWGAVMILSLLTATVGAEPRNQWYRDSHVWIHCDNHSSLLGRGLSVDDLTAMFGTIPFDMLQVSAQSNTYATYPTEVGWNHPQADGYDTVGTFREVTRRLGKRLCLYMSVDRRPVQLKEHPEWCAIGSDGKPIINGEPIVCQRPNRQHQGYLYEQFIPQIQELVRKYDPAGFWYDGDYILTRPCWCPNCLAEWQAETGKEAPRDAKSPDWQPWLDWHFQRYQAYRQAVADAIHQASPKALYTSNWSFAWNPEPVPDYIDTLSGDAWRIKQVVCVTQRWGAQQQTPWDVMSYCTPASRTFRDYSLQRTLQEGALTIASGGVWCLWSIGGDTVPDAGIALTRHCAAWDKDRQPALGPSVSLSQVAVLDSETSWRAGGPTGTDAPAHSVARSLAEAHYFTDVVNEATFRRHLTPYRVVVLPDCKQVAPETLADLQRFASDGGLVVVCGGALEGAGPELLGLSREPREGRQPLPLGRGKASLGGLWSVKTTTAEVVARFGDGTPAVTRQKLGQGAVAYFATSELRYPDDAQYAAVLAKLGVGPSYRVEGAPQDAGILCTLRKRGADYVLHTVDLATKIEGVNVDVDTEGLTEWNPIRRTAVHLNCDQEPTSLTTYPRGVRTGARSENGQLRIAFTDWQTHAAAVFRLPDGAKLGMLPAATPLPPDSFHPESDRAGVVFADDFTSVPVGQRLAKTPWMAMLRTGTDITAANQGRHCLKFTDAPDCSFYPFLHRSIPSFQRGIGKLSYDLQVGAKANCLMELRYEGKGAGPALRLDGDGNLTHAGQDLAKLQPDTWYHFEVTVRLGDQGPSFDLRVTPPTGEPLVFTKLPYATEWFFLCNSVYFVGSGNEAGEFYLANVKFERLQPGN